MIQLESLSKDYDNFEAVKDLTLHVKKGELFGFLGPNGAGKTTTIKMIAGVLKPTKGRIIIDGHDVNREPEKAKSVLGFIPDSPFLYNKLTGREFLSFVAGLYNMDGPDCQRMIEELLDLFELTDWGDELIESYSHGMKQKLVMSSAFIHKPKVIVVDEPMVGLDPKSARLVKEVFKRMCASGLTIFMSTHTMEVAQEMCDRIGIINEGGLIVLGTMEELKQQAESGDDRLETIFLKLTGGEEMKEIIRVLRM
jgi:ABC-2 type transport system ATP-binding protein